MEPNDTPPPLFINESSLVAQLATAGRYIMAAAGSFALDKGWVDGETLQFITGLATVVAPLGYGVWKTWREKRKLIRVANQVSDAVAIVVKKR